MKPEQATKSPSSRSERSEWLLAIDPGVCTGWAWFENGKLAWAGVGEPSKIDPWETYDCICECPQIYPRSPVPPNDLIAVAVQVGTYVERFKAKLVLPATWKGQLKKEIVHARMERVLTAEEKKVYPKLAKSYAHNMLDAVGIGLWYLGRLPKSGVVR